MAYPLSRGRRSTGPYRLRPHPIPCHAGHSVWPDADVRLTLRRDNRFHVSGARAARVARERFHTAHTSSPLAPSRDSSPGSVAVVDSSLSLLYAICFERIG